MSEYDIIVIGGGCSGMVVVVVARWLRCCRRDRSHRRRRRHRAEVPNGKKCRKTMEQVSRLMDCLQTECLRTHSRKHITSKHRENSPEKNVKPAVKTAAKRP